MYNKIRNKYMKNIAIALGGGLVFILFVAKSGVTGSFLTVILPFIPLLIYVKLTTYKTKFFIIAGSVGIVASFLVYFVLGIIGIMFGFGNVGISNSAYISTIIALLVPILTYRKLLKT